MSLFIGTIGMPGVGKGTILGNFLEGRESRYRIVAVSDLLKKQIANNTELGQKAKSYMDAGQLVPDDLIIDMVINELNASEKTVFLDGFSPNSSSSSGNAESRNYSCNGCGIPRG